MKHEFSACIGVDERGHLRIEDADAVELAEDTLAQISVDNPRRMLSGQ